MRLHRLGVGATAAGRPAVGARHLRAGLRLLGWPTEQADRVDGVAGVYGVAEVDGVAGRGAVAGVAGVDAALAARLLISLAHAEAEQGRTGRGLGLLDGAEALVAPEDRGLLLQQRGLLLLRTGRTGDALRLLDAAVPLLSAAGDDVVLARTLLNRSVLHLGAGRVRAARADLRDCERLASAHGLDVLAAKSGHNLGYCDLYTGDIPAALRAFEAARDVYARHAPGVLPTLTLDRSRALLSAGLAEEAGRELDAALHLFRRQRLSQDHAEAELTRAQAALDAGDFGSARRWAGRAGRRFARRGNAGCAALADLMRLRADFQAGRSGQAGSPRPGRIVGHALRLAERLRGFHLDHDAEVAELLAVRAMLAAGRRAEAGRRAARVARSPYAAPIETQLLRRLTRAELTLAHARRGEALAQLRAGLAALQAHRSRFGSLDFQTSSAALGRELAGAGLDAALGDGAPRLVFAWSERSRAQAFRLRPVRAAADPETAEAVAELRQLSQALRAAELDGRAEPGVRARCAELERAIRERGWQARGAGVRLVVPTLAAVAAELATAGRVMVNLLHRRGQLLALVVGEGCVRVVGLGRYGVVEEAQRRLLGDLNALAGRRLPARMAAVVQQSARRQLEVLTAGILAPLRPALGDRDLVVVPTMALSGLPWGLLPELRGRPVAVAPSAAAWLAARSAGPGVGARSAGPGVGAGSAGPGVADPLPALVAGPDLRHADEEIDGIAAVYPRSRTLRAGGATVAATLAALEGAPIAHLAAHGHHERDNVLFSRLDLADGPLMAYDVHQLARAPRHVVLSACDVGRTVVRAGDEILGFTAALLYAGSGSVVACVARVPDDAAARVMVAYHRAVAGGVEPARALAAATADEPYVAFGCFGAG